MQYVAHNPGVCLLMITVLHEDAFTNGNDNLPWCDTHSVGWWSDELCNIGNQYSKVPSCSFSHEGSSSNCLAICCIQTLSCAHPCLSARVDSFKLSGVSMSHVTSNLATLQLVLQVRNEYRVCIYAWEVLTLADRQCTITAQSMTLLSWVKGGGVAQAAQDTPASQTWCLAK